MEMEKYPHPRLPPSLPPFFHACRSDEYHPCSDPLQSFFPSSPAHLQLFIVHPFSIVRILNSISERDFAD